MRCVAYENLSCIYASWIWDAKLTLTLSPPVTWLLTLGHIHLRIHIHVHTLCIKETKPLVLFSVVKLDNCLMYYIKRSNRVLFVCTIVFSITQKVFKRSVIAFVLENCIKFINFTFNFDHRHENNDFNSPIAISQNANLAQWQFAGHNSATIMTDPGA